MNAGPRRRELESDPRGLRSQTGAKNTVDLPLVNSIDAIPVPESSTALLVAAGLAALAARRR